VIHCRRNRLDLVATQSVRYSTRGLRPANVVGASVEKESVGKTPLSGCVSDFCRSRRPRPSPHPSDARRYLAAPRGRAGGIPEFPGFPPVRTPRTGRGFVGRPEVLSGRPLGIGAISSGRVSSVSSGVGRVATAFGGRPSERGRGRARRPHPSGEGLPPGGVRDGGLLARRGVSRGYRHPPDLARPLADRASRAFGS